MYTEIGLDELFALVKEIYETSPDAWLEISVQTGCDWNSGEGGSICFSHSKEVSVRKQEGGYGVRPNPNLDASWMGKKFRKLCRKHGVEPEVYDDLC